MFNILLRFNFIFFFLKIIYKLHIHHPKLIALYSLHYSFRQSCNKLLQYHPVHKFANIKHLNEQPPLAGIIKLLCENKWLAELNEGQGSESLPLVFQSMADLLQNHLFEIFHGMLGHP